VAKIVSNEPIAVENFRDLAPFVRVPLDRIGSPLSADWPYTKARLAERLGFEALERPDQTPVGAEEGVEEESVGEGASGEGEMG
jgi:hypothetical protein